MNIFDIWDSEVLTSYTIIIINRAPKLLNSNCYFGVNKNGVTWWAYSACESKWGFMSVLLSKESLVGR
jgi:hypothetical protein